MKERIGRLYTLENVHQLTADLNWNVREEYGDIELLKTQIRENGIITPIKVRKVGDEIQVVDGHRRVVALRELHEEGLGFEIPILLLNGSEIDYLKELVLSNEGKQLTVLEMAEAARRMEAEGMSRKEIADVFGRSQSTVSNWLKFFTLSEDSQNRVREGSSSIEVEVGDSRKKKAEKITAQVDKFDPGTVIQFNSVSYIRGKIKEGYKASRNKEVWEVVSLIMKNEITEKEIQNIFGLTED